MEECHCTILLGRHCSSVQFKVNVWLYCTSIMKQYLDMSKRKGINNVESHIVIIIGHCSLWVINCWKFLLLELSTSLLGGGRVWVMWPVVWKQLVVQMGGSQNVYIIPFAVQTIYGLGFWVRHSGNNPYRYCLMNLW